jgi:hypothetical protein
MHFPKILQKAWRDSAIRAVALILLPCAFANAGKIEPGHSAMWINPDHDGVDGEGWVLEILSNDRAALYWYTSDDEGKPRWIISNGAGSIVPGEDGDKIVFPELVTGHGGRFAQDVPASDVTLEVVGTAEMRFSDCNTGEISFDAYGKTATYPLTRLSRTMGAVCSPVGSPVQPYAGTSGTWFESEHNGGPVFTLQWLENGAAILFWFAYDPEGHPFWAAGLGTYENELLTFPQMDYVSGGRFGEHDPSAPAVLVPWGSLEMHFTCDDATVSYNATAEGFGFGMFNLKPLTKLAKPACPYVKAKLTDLYDIELIELPEEPATPGTETQMGSGNLILYGSVANNGTVAALRKILDREYIWNYPVRLTLESMTWENILDMSASSRVAGWPIISAHPTTFRISSARVAAIIRNMTYSTLSACGNGAANTDKPICRAI